MGKTSKKDERKEGFGDSNPPTWVWILIGIACILFIVIFISGFKGDRIGPTNPRYMKKKWPTSH